MASESRCDYVRSDGELRQIQFRLALTPAERLEVNGAFLRERMLKCSLARQVRGILDLNEIPARGLKDAWAE